MKSAFTFNGKHYISPSKKEARKFLKFYSQPRLAVYRFKTNWKIKHVECVPSWGQVMRVKLDNVEFGTL